MVGFSHFLGNNHAKLYICSQGLKVIWHPFNQNSRDKADFHRPDFINSYPYPGLPSVLRCSLPTFPNNVATIWVFVAQGTPKQIRLGFVRPIPVIHRMLFIT